MARFRALLIGLILVLPSATCIAEPPADEPVSNLGPLVDLLGQVDDADFQLDVLSGIHQAVTGRRQLTAPKGWTAVFAKLSKSPSKQVREKATLLAVMFGDQKAIDQLQKLAANSSAQVEPRARAIAALVQRKDPSVVTLLYKLLDDSAVRRAALQGLSEFDDPRTASEILARYNTFSPAEKQAAVGTLSVRAKNARALLIEMDAGRIGRADLSAFAVRQLNALDDPQINGLLEKVWGSIRPTAADKQALISKFKSSLSADGDPPDLMLGRQVFVKTCASCHRLFGEGGQVGPDLTGSQRTNLDYVLENLLDPNAIVGRDFQVTVVVTEGGRVISGLVREENNNTLTLQTPTETVIIPKDEIGDRSKSQMSMMPEGLLENLADAQVRGLIAYLASPVQVEIPVQEVTGDN